MASMGDGGMRRGPRPARGYPATADVAWFGVGYRLHLRRLRVAMIELGMTTARLAEDTGYSRSTVSRLFNQPEAVSREVVAEVATALGLKLRDVLERVD